MDPTPASFNRRCRSQRRLIPPLLLLFLQLLAASTPDGYAVTFNLSLAPLTNHNTSANSAYNENNFPANFGTSTWISQNGQTMPVDPAQADESLNPVTPGHVSKSDVHTLIPSRPDLRWFAHATPWFGSHSHIDIGLTNDSAAYVAAMITDMKNRGFNGVIIDWYGMTDSTDGVVQKIKAYLASLTNNTFTYIVMVDGGIHGGTGLANLETNIEYCQTQYFNDPNYEHEPLSSGQPILMFFGVRNSIGQANMATLKAATGGDMVWVEQGTGYLSESWEDECFEWTDQFNQGVNAADPFNLSAVTNNFTTIKNSGKKAFGAMCSQFDGTLTMTTAWSKGKYLPSSNGLCLVERALSVNLAIPPNMTRMQWPTWSDWEEGTEVESGIENHVALAAQVNGSLLTWAVTGGEARTIDHFEVYASPDGVSAALLASLPATATQTDLSLPGLPPGAYAIYVDAVGIPCVRDHMSAPVPFAGGPVFSPADYSRQMRIIFAGYDRPTTLTNFPALVELGTNLAGFNYGQFASPAGNDLRFTDADGNLLPWEIDQWNTNGVSLVWVNVARISSASDYIMAYWGNPAATNAPSWSTNGAAWPGYSAVYHLKESAFPYADSSGQHPAASGVAPTVTAVGKVGKAELFNGSSAYLAPAGPVNLGNSFSLSAWVNLDPAAQNIQTIWDNKNTGGAANGVALYLNSYNTSDGRLVLETGDGSTGLTVTTTSGAVATGGWHHVFASVNRGAGIAALYVDGVDRTSSGAIVKDLGSAGMFNLGRFTNSTWYFKGALDEARIGPARSADWVWATWMNAASNSIFVACGAATPTEALDPTTFSWSSRLTIAGYGGGTALTNFPLLVNLANIPGLTYTQFASPHGYDLRFTDASGKRLCPFEFDSWNTQGTSSVWVLVPAISSSTSSIVAYWGNPALTNPPDWTTNGAVWPDSAAVFHLKENGFPYADSTGRHPATAGVAPTLIASGKIGGAELFNGSSQYLAPAGAIGLGNAFSLSAWIDLNPAAANIQTIWDNKNTGGSSDGVALFVNTYNTTDGKLSLETGDGVTGLTATTVAGAVPAGGWHYVVASINRAAGTAALYVDGMDKTAGNAIVSDFANSGPMDLGCFTNGTWYIHGAVDETRIEPARSSDWVQAAWLNVVSNSMFLSCTPAAPPEVFNNPPPVLQVSLGVGGLLFNWPQQPGAPFALYSATNLTLPVVWTPVTNYTVLPDGQVQVPVSNDPGSCVYYRLQSE